VSDELAGLIADLEEEQAIARVRARLATGEAPGAIIEDCQAGLAVVGDRYREGTYFIAGLIMAGEIFREVMEILEPLVGPAGAPDHRPSGPTAGSVLVCTVQGDIHDLGKNLLVMLLRSMNFEVVDLGVDVPPEDIVREALDRRPDVVGLSGMLLTSFPAMRATIAALREAFEGQADAPAIIVGGGQMTEGTASWVGADDWSDNAGEAVPTIERLVATTRAGRTE
jgi:5-methyltetrahydrofolate--homocysteine methyltransferase